MGSQGGITMKLTNIHYFIKIKQIKFSMATEIICTQFVHQKNTPHPSGSDYTPLIS